MHATLGASSWVLGPWNMATAVTLPYLLQIVSEWTAIIPLACHLASYKRDHELVGQLALTGHLSVDIFPKLGVLYGLSKLLRRSTEFIDHASTKGSQSWTVWDVRWGSIFPYANGGASSMIIQHIVGDTVTTMPDTLPESLLEGAAPAQIRSPASAFSHPRADSTTFSSSGATRINETVPLFPPNRPVSISQKAALRNSALTFPHGQTGGPSKGHRRMQTLHVLQVTRRSTRFSWLRRVDIFVRSYMWQLVSNFCILCTVVALIVLGLYGAAIITACGIIAQFGCRLVMIERPPEYLRSSEADEQTFMLFGLHQNTGTWYLFVGDRGVIDSLLNKIMVTIIPSRWSNPLAWLLRYAHAVQLVAMTFVAGQKGWDGMALVVLMVINTLGRWTSDNGLVVRKWMESEDIDIKVKSFGFTGRTMMLGAIQEFSQSQCESWMDGMVSPHPRRDAWVTRLRILTEESHAPGDALNNTSGR